MGCTRGIYFVTLPFILIRSKFTKNPSSGGKKKRDDEKETENKKKNTENGAYSVRTRRQSFDLLLAELEMRNTKEIVTRISEESVEGRQVRRGTKKCLPASQIFQIFVTTPTIVFQFETEIKIFRSEAKIEASTKTTARILSKCFAFNQRRERLIFLHALSLLESI